MSKKSYDRKYSENLPKTNDFLVNRQALFKRTLKELHLETGDRILEVGCDRGYFVNVLKKKLILELCPIHLIVWHLTKQLKRLSAKRFCT